MNDHGDELRPLYVWGRNHDQLTTTETLFIKFFAPETGWQAAIEKQRNNAAPDIIWDLYKR